jgi:hypothetical protein
MKVMESWRVEDEGRWNAKKSNVTLSRKINVDRPDRMW